MKLIGKLVKIDRRLKGIGERFLHPFAISFLSHVVTREPFFRSGLRILILSYFQETISIFWFVFTGFISKSLSKI